MNKHSRLFSTSLLSLLLTFTLVTTVNAATLSYWYSDATMIGKWSTSPKVWYSKIDTTPTFAFFSGLLNGEDIWNDALGTSIDVSSSYTTAPIKFYGGTKAQLDALSIFNPVASNDLGLTSYTNITNSGTHKYNGASKTWYTYNEINGYVVSRSDMSYDNYVKTASHEIGHAMGWRGHPSSTQPTWVMQQGKLENITLSTSEKNHLSQIY